MRDFLLTYEDSSTMLLHPSFFPVRVPMLRMILRDVDQIGQAEAFQNWAMECFEELPEVYKKAADAQKAEAKRLLKEASGAAKKATDLLKRYRKEKDEGLHTEYLKAIKRRDDLRMEAQNCNLEAARNTRLVKKLNANREEVEAWQKLPKRKSQGCRKI